MRTVWQRIMSLCLDVFTRPIGNRVADKIRALRLFTRSGTQDNSLSFMIHDQWIVAIFRLVETGVIRTRLERAQSAPSGLPSRANKPGPRTTCLIYRMPRGLFVFNPLDRHSSRY